MNAKNANTMQMGVLLTSQSINQSAKKASFKVGHMVLES